MTSILESLGLGQEWLSILMMIPLSLMGIYWLYDSFLKPRVKAKRGFIRVITITASGHMRMAMVKPEFMAEDGNETGYIYDVNGDKHQYIDKSGMVYEWNGMKTALYDTDGSQIDLSNLSKATMPVTPKILDALAKRTWNVAKSTVSRKENIMQMLILIAIGLAAASALLAFNNMTRLEDVIGLIGSLA